MEHLARIIRCKPNAVSHTVPRHLTRDFINVFLTGEISQVWFSTRISVRQLVLDVIVNSLPERKQAPPP